MNKYDEVLLENKFFKCLKCDNFDLFKEAVSQKYLICIPKASVTSNVQLTTLLDHILIPAQKNSNNIDYCTKNNNKIVLKEGKFISKVNLNRCVNILFEETFYEEELGKYKVLCVDDYISSLFKDNFTPNPNSLLDIKHSLKNLRTINDFVNCISDLVDDSSVFDEIDKYLSDILSMPFSKANPPETVYLRTLVHKVLKKTLNYVLQAEIKLDENYSLVLTVCIESYVLHNLHNILFQYSGLEMSSKDEKLNRILHSLKEVTEADLNVHVTNINCILSARYELAAINNFKSPFGKFQCIKKTIDSFKTESKLTLDELIPILVLTIIKCNLSNWFANLNFIQTYSFTLESNSEYSFILSTFEASLAFLFSEELNEQTVSSGYVLTSKESSFCLDTFNPRAQHYGNEIIHSLYDYIKKDNLESVKRILEVTESEKSVPKNIVSQKYELNLCHPLCVCNECKQITQKSLKSDFLLDFNHKDENLMTPLHIAVWYGSLNIVEYLMSKNVNLNAKNIVGMTPLHIAAYKGYQTILLLLLNAGCDIDSTDSSGNTALQLACTAGHDSCVKALIFYAESIGYKFNFGEKNINGDTALHLASFWGYMNIVKFLLSQPRIVIESIGTKNLKNQTPLDCAHNEAVALLIEGAIENAEESAHTDLLLLNLEERNNVKIDPEQKLDDGDVFTNKNDLEHTDTHFEVRENSSDSEVNNILIKILNAIKVGDNRLALFYLDINVNEPNMNESSKCHPLCQCTDCSNITTTTISVNKRKSLINFIGEENYGILHVAVLKGDIELCQILLQNGANPQALTKSERRSCIHLSVQRENIELLKLLIKFNVDINCADTMGNTPLHLCCICGWKEGVITLVESGAEVNINNKDGSSPKEEADKNGHFEIVRYLVRKMSEAHKKSTFN
ncbi:UNVERIFIED_CONTAM: hypothetical protein RMT77_010925 [Armadillidium vulgare]